MKTITLGTTGNVTPQNGFGALPIQRVSDDEAVSLLRQAWHGGMTFFDTARAYSDSEHKIGLAFGDWGHNDPALPRREDIFIASKTGATTPDAFWADLETSLSNLRTDHLDIYQFHNPDVVFEPGDGTGMYECMLAAREQGKIRHIGITAHKIANAEKVVATGLYETLQYPFNYLAIEREVELVRATEAANMGFIGMKGMSGGLITNASAAMAWDAQFDNVVPIWGIQRQRELDEWLSFMDGPAGQGTPRLDDEMRAFIDGEREELKGDFCRSCGYCMPCPQGIQIFQCARMSQLLRRMPSKNWLTPYWQDEMARITTCTNCRQCASKCPYDLDTPELLKLNYADYQRVLSGEVSVE